MNIKLSQSPKKFKGVIKLPSSKSISNRLLIIRALCDKPFEIDNLSDSNDTGVLIRALESDDEIINVGHAGTAMRFLTAYYAITEGERILTGSDRMKNRPIEKLVEALKQLGANIEYVEKEGFPPLKIKGNPLKKDLIEIDGSISSQYISALLMVAPRMPGGLKIYLKNNVISSSYINLTLQLMKYFGIEYTWEENVITIKKQAYSPASIKVERDWSAASYWYELVALANRNAEVFLPGVTEKSLQGDSVIAQLFSSLGVQSIFDNEGVKISRLGKPIPYFSYDFINCPDMVQTFAVTLVMLGIPFRFSGTQSLKIKETDRILALQNELGKFGAELAYSTEGILKWEGIRKNTDTNNLVIPTYEDHRMAMAFAPAVTRCNNLVIENPDVVKKSYPGFWDDFRQLGFKIETV